MTLAEFISQLPPGICATIISTLGVVFSAWLSARVSKKTTKAEITAERERRQETWEYERKTTYNSEFAEMVTAITLYLNGQTPDAYKQAVRMLNIVRTKESGDFAHSLDGLYHLLTDKFDDEIIATNLQQLEMELSHAIEESRKYYCKNAPGDH